MAAPVRGASSSTDSARQDMLSPEPSRSKLRHQRLAIAGASRPSEPRAPRPARDPARDPPPALPPGPARHRPRRVSCEKASAPETVPGAQGPPPPRPPGCAEVWGSSPAGAGESCTFREQALRAYSGRPGEPHPRELRRPKGCYSWRPGRERPSVRRLEAHPAVEARGPAPVPRYEPAVRAPPGLSPLPGSQL